MLLIALKLGAEWPRIVQKDPEWPIVPDHASGSLQKPLEAFGIVSKGF